MPGKASFFSDFQSPVYENPPSSLRMVIDERELTSRPPISFGSIILPLQRQVPTEFPKALVSAGSGRGIPPCPPFGAVSPAFAVPPASAVVPCCASAASAIEHRANNSRFIASLLATRLARTLPRP